MGMHPLLIHTLPMIQSLDEATTGALQYTPFRGCTAKHSPGYIFPQACFLECVILDCAVNR